MEIRNAVEILEVLGLIGLAFSQAAIWRRIARQPAVGPTPSIENLDSRITATNIRLGSVATEMAKEVEVLNNRLDANLRTLTELSKQIRADYGATDKKIDHLDVTVGAFSARFDAFLAGAAAAASVQTAPTLKGTA